MKSFHTSISVWENLRPRTEKNSIRLADVFFFNFLLLTLKKVNQ